jgi:CRP/FNR family transcriptional regulator, anaerobic regulatory protein
MSLNCANCSLANLCLPIGLTAQEMALLDNAIKKRATIKRGEVLCQAGNPLAALYAVRSGAFKAEITSNSGETTINAFYLPGELIGLEAVHDKIYPATITALETSSVCMTVFDNLLKLATDIPNLQRQLLSMMSQRIEQANTFPLTSSANQRVATFLLNISTRFNKRGLSATHFRLPMPRQDIARFLGLATETLSRCFSAFESQGMIEQSRRDIILSDINKLQALANNPNTKEPHNGSS